MALNKERNEWAFKNAAAIEKANEETQHMRKDVAILEEKAEQMRSECAHYREEIVTLNQKVGLLLFLCNIHAFFVLIQL